MAACVGTITDAFYGASSGPRSLDESSRFFLLLFALLVILCDACSRGPKNGQRYHPARMMKCQAPGAFKPSEDTKAHRGNGSQHSSKPRLRLVLLHVLWATEKKKI